MTSRLKVDVGQGHHEQVQVQPTTTLGFVLEEVCKRRKLDPSCHDLRHQRKALDRSLTVRFAGLSSNAMLELVSGRGPATHGECTIGLQQEGGGRQMAKLLTSLTLAEVIAQLAPDAVAPCIVYVGRAVSGAALATTTLQDLGIAKGASALLRLSQEADGAAATVAPPDGGHTLATDDAPIMPTERAVTPPEDAMSDFVVVSASASPEAEAAAESAAAPPTMPQPAAPPPAAPPRAAPPPTPPPPSMPVVDAMEEDDAADAPQVEMLGEAVAMLEEACGAIAVASGVPTATAVHESVGLLSKYTSNLLANPSEVKYRAIKKGNARFHAAIGQHAAARQLLRLVGFEADLTSPEPLWVLPMHTDLKPLRLLDGLLARRRAHVQLPPENQLTAAAAAGALAPASVPAAPAPRGGSSSSYAMASAEEGGAFVASSSNVVGSANRPAASQSGSQSGSRAAATMTLTEASVMALRAKKVLVRPELSVPRKLAVMRPGVGRAVNPPVPDVSDEFYDLGEDDLRGITLAGGGGANHGGRGVMQTAAMRELEKLKAIKEYTHARVRVRLPGGLLVEASYHPQEPVSHITDLALSCLIEPLSTMGAYLFVTPPRTELEADLSLVQAGLVPAATAVLAWRAGALPAEIAARPPEDLLRPHARELLDEALSAKANPEDAAADFPILKGAAGAAAAARADVAAGKRVAPSGGETAAGAEDGGDGAGENKGKSKPKWLRM